MPYKDKEKERLRNKKRRETKEYKEYQRKYQRMWRKKNKERVKEIQRKSNSRPERKLYIRKWWKESPKAKEIKRRFQKSEKAKQYQKEWIRKNPDKVKAKQDKYQYTKKGILNQIKKVQNRRIKFKKISGVYYNIPNKKLIEFVDERDKVCIYCGREFSKDKKSRFYRSYDHLDPFKPHSKTNTVKCCISCNSSKGEKNVFEWAESKGYKISKVIYELSK